jgi:carbon storage regulator
MLLMRRRQGEIIRIGDDIEIHLVHIGRTRVKIAIQAPRELRVVTQEVEIVGAQNRAAAALDGQAVSAALARFAKKSSSPPNPVR